MGPVRPISKTYTITNNTKAAMSVSVSTDANWVDLDSTKLESAPGKSAKVTAQSNALVNEMIPVARKAAICFSNPQTGDTNERRLTLVLSPVSLAVYKSFDTAAQVPLIAKSKTPAPVPPISWAAEGIAGGALRLDSPRQPLTFSKGEYFSWGGVSASFYLKLDALPL